MSVRVVVCTFCRKVLDTEALRENHGRDSDGVCRDL